VNQGPDIPGGVDSFFFPFLKAHRSASVTASYGDEDILLITVALQGYETTVGVRPGELVAKRLELSRLIEYRFAEATRQAEATRHV
jgi:hypothetical protein